MNIERYFIELGVAAERNEQLPIDEIDNLKSLTNQARIKPLDEPTVERYALDLEAGDTFPPIIVWRRNTRSKLILLGGNHRYAAHRRLKRTTIDAYVVDCDELTATRITYEDNRNHGLSLTQPERIAHATHLVDLGWKVAAAARITGLSPQIVDRANGITRVGRRALDLGLNVSDFTRLSETSRWRLGYLKLDTIFTAAAELCVAARCTTDEVYQLVTELNSSGTEQRALALIDARRTSWALRIRRGRKLKDTPTAKLNDACFTVTGLPVAKIIESCNTTDEREALAKRCALAVEHLTKVITTLGVKARGA